MQNLFNPKWLFVVNTLPLAVLFFLFFGQFNIIKSLLDDSSLALWMYFSISLAILGILNLAYAVYLTYKGKNVSIWYGLLALVLYIPYIYIYSYFLEEVIPFSIPDWMISDNIFLYVGTFLMPTLAYSLFILVTHFTPEHKVYNASKSFAFAIGVPIVGYIFAQIILPLWQPFDTDFGTHAILILTIAATVIFLFFLIRGVYILAIKKTDAWQKYQLAWKIPISIVLPLIGLSLNNGHLLNDFGPGGPGVFGDFSNIWFYTLAILNGIFICLPNYQNKTYRLLLFIGRSVTFAYTLYFFLVFLPFLPLSVIAIIAFGTGFLMLTPLILFVIHTNELSRDYTHLTSHFPKKIILGVSILGFFIIPILITSVYLKNKSVLNKTLTYLYSPDYSKKYTIDTNSLQKTLHFIKGHKDSRSGIFGNGTPYLSSYFNWLVMDNLTLSDAKINSIEKIFFDKNSHAPQSENIRNDSVLITNISSNSILDETQNAWKSWIDLEISNKDISSRFGEYATTIDLPPGCWISDYYLYVQDVKEPGILAEKRSAMWIYSQIRNENRDPGILYYLTGNKVAFRVFPFAKDEVRKTGIEFLHKEPIRLTIDSNIIELGTLAESSYDNIETKNVTYLSARQKKELNSIKRKPYFHFLVDVSRGQKSKSTDFIKRIDKVVKNNQALSENAKISFVNSYVTTATLDGGWKDQYSNQTFSGGFYLDRAIRKTLFHSYQEKTQTYPVIVVVTENIQDAVLSKDYTDLKLTFPESDLFYNLDHDGNLNEHSLTNQPSKRLPATKRECLFCDSVLVYQTDDNAIAYLPDNNEPSIILKKDLFEVSDAEIKEKNWESALTMHGLWTSQVLHPEKSNKEWLNMVKHSFTSRVMTPVTSYIVVENEAQKAMLKKKQEQVLSGNKSLDLGEDPQRMSEPSLMLLIILLGLSIWYREKRKKQSVQ